MTLENKLNITDSTELARMEEKISKKKAVELFENEYLNQCEVGTFQMLAAIHKYLFDEIYDFAGKIRTVNIARRIVSYKKFCRSIMIKCTKKICLILIQWHISNQNIVM